ncbi:transglutaminase domain-containing protein [Lacrimispora amygdalina]|uniref:transglutaminase domain-containing protein n=1 Tax=Lacrimispora amygdalina TaxID=253257 RepID=UPI0011422042|nr:transglutaminase domain-containing protein [Lacrimispora amygdalina]
MKQIVAMAITMTTLAVNVFPAYAAQFGSILDGDGSWSNTNNMTWSFNNGGSVTIGRGPVFSDVYPEITDPEHFLKEAVIYPGEAVNSLNSEGLPKANYTEGTLPLLQEFVNSFDWIHSDELTRLEMVFDRLHNGKDGREDQTSGKHFPSVSFKVLEGKIGNCGDYSGEFQRLASYVGLESIAYDQSAVHAACLVKINGQWITVDPMRKEGLYNNLTTVPVDYDTEYNRYANEAKSSQWYQDQMQQVEWQRQAEAGKITWIEYYQRLYPGMSEAEIQKKFMSWDGYVDGLGN